jgi:hypothetical protein
MEKSYRVHTNINKDKVIKVQLKNDIAVFDVLSMKIDTTDAYNIHTSNYGVIVGRVLANDAFGVPNVKLSLFVPISDDDTDNVDIYSLYDFSNVTDTGSDGKKYNLLQNSYSHGFNFCAESVGSFPIKRVVLDNDTEIEIFDKYWKYTTVTNNSGDYMFFGVPTGSSQVHIDCDLSDIGILSQHPSDFINKGYSADLFESPSKFKTGTDIGNLPQILSQDKSVYVYSFWGDTDENEIGITRSDINLNYTFEPSCVFMGSIITDIAGNHFASNGQPMAKQGAQDNLTTTQGRIEMIRKTLRGLVEEYSINGNELIDSSGIFCYQIPMNLDYIGTDEYGNIIRIDDINKGIPTRTRVRFRISLPGFEDGSNGEFSAKILIPNNPPLKRNVRQPVLSAETDLTTYYEFGTNTPDECFRDLYWDKVYSVKEYIPRITKGQNVGFHSHSNNDSIRKNYPFGFNQPFNCIKTIHPATNINAFPYNTLYVGSETLNDTHAWINDHFKDPPEGESLMDAGIYLTFENDWVNGCLYMPLFAMAEKEGIKEFFDVDSNIKDIYLYSRLNYIHTSDITIQIGENFQFMELYFGKGIIKRVKNKNGLYVYYYAFGGKSTSDKYVRLYSNDIILLGNLYDRIDYLPKLFSKLPVTTSIIPSIISYSEVLAGDNTSIYDTQIDEAGMYWSSNGGAEVECRNDTKGIFFCYVATSTPNCICYGLRGQVNAERLSELDVENDKVTYDETGKERRPDGYIWRKSITTNDNRSAFASMNFDINGYNIDTALRIKKFKPHFLYLTDFDGRFSASELTRINDNWHAKNGKEWLEKANTYLSDSYRGEQVDKSYLIYRFGNSTHHIYLSAYLVGINPLYALVEAAWATDRNRNKYGTFPLFENSFYFYFGLYANNNAITQLKEKYYGECTENAYLTDAIITLISKKNAPSCTNAAEGSFVIDTSSVKKPFSYQVANNYGSIIAEASNVSDDTVTVKNLPNNSYIFTITDYNGYSESLNVVLRAQLPYPDYRVISFGRTVTTEAKDNDCGEIRIYGFFIDDNYYTITSVETSTVDGNIEANITCSLDKETRNVIIDDTSKEVDISKPDGKNYILIKTYLPQLYEFKVTEAIKKSWGNSFIFSKCGHSQTISINVPNGSEFSGYINNVPLSYLKTDVWEKVYDISNYNFPEGTSTVDKLGYLSKMCNMVYNLNGSTLLQFTTTGGKADITISGKCADYDALTNTYIPNSGYTITTANYPNYVYGNYTTYGTGKSNNFTVVLNNPIGNKNDNYPTSLIAEIDDTKINTLTPNPYFSKANGNLFTAKDSNNRDIEFALYNIDKRMDYALSIQTPCYGVSNGSIAGKIYNGILMSYGDEYNLIGYEYEYEKDTLVYNAKGEKKPYFFKINDKDYHGYSVIKGDDSNFSVMDIPEEKIDSASTGTSISVGSCSYNFIIDDVDTLSAKTTVGDIINLNISYESPLKFTGQTSSIFDQMQANNYIFTYGFDGWPLDPAENVSSGYNSNAAWKITDVNNAQGYSYTKINPQYGVLYTGKTEVEWTTMSSGTVISMPDTVGDYQATGTTKNGSITYTYCDDGYEIGSDTATLSPSKVYSMPQFNMLSNSIYLQFKTMTVCENAPSTASSLTQQVEITNVSKCLYTGYVTFESDNMSGKVTLTFKNMDAFDFSTAEYGLMYVIGETGGTTQTIFETPTVSNEGDNGISFIPTVYEDKVAGTITYKTTYHFGLRLYGDILYDFVWTNNSIDTPAPNP